MKNYKLHVGTQLQIVLMGRKRIVDKKEWEDIPYLKDIDVIKVEERYFDNFCYWIVTSKVRGKGFYFMEFMVIPPLRSEEF